MLIGVGEVQENKQILDFDPISDQECSRLVAEWKADDSRLKALLASMEKEMEYIDTPPYSPEKEARRQELKAASRRAANEMAKLHRRNLAEQLSETKYSRMFLCESPAGKRTYSDSKEGVERYYSDFLRMESRANQRDLEARIARQEEFNRSILGRIQNTLVPPGIGLAAIPLITTYAVIGIAIGAYFLLRKN